MLRRIHFAIACVGLLAASLVSPAPVRAAEPLPPLGTDPAQTSISGLSSGAYMAVQFHVAHSETVVGVGVVAGGPYGCAESWFARTMPWMPGASAANAIQAQYSCMQTNWLTPGPEALADRAAALAEAGMIDPLQGLAGDRVYLFSGSADETVIEDVVAAAADFYRAVGTAEEELVFLYGSPANHAFITDEVGSSCGVGGSPFMNDCDYDQAGAILAHIYGPLADRVAAPAGRFVAFDQAAFLADPTSLGMAEDGIVYIPPACETETGCRLHIALHGCRQNRAMVGTAFIEGAGYARWADANRLVILYPQTSESPGNPRACWDWWGYSAGDFRSRAAPQIRALKAMVDRLAARP